MVSLKEGRGKTLSWAFAALGLVVGLFVYDLTASSRTLHNADCQQLAPVVGDFFAKADDFIARDPAKWHRIEKVYESLAEELEAYLPTTEVMQKHGAELQTTMAKMAGAVYGFNPNARNRERLAETSKATRAHLQTIEEVCR